MTNPQEAKLNMYNVVIGFCNQNQAIIDSMPALQSAFVSFKEAVEEIESATLLQAVVTSGIATDKGELRKLVAQQATPIAAALFAYASSVNNNKLKEQVNLSATQILRLKDDELPVVCMNMANAANENLAAMKAYNITADTIKEFNNIIAQYKSSVPGPRHAATQRASQLTLIKTLFRKADGILRHQMDKIITRFILSNPSFYTNYAGNRAIIDPGTTHTQIKGTVTDTNEDIPVNNAQIRVLENETVVTTGGRGRYMIKPLKPGEYSLKITKEGFTDKTVTGLLVKLGQITTVDIQITRSHVE